MLLKLNKGNRLKSNNKLHILIHTHTHTHTHIHMKQRRKQAEITSAKYRRN